MCYVASRAPTGLSQSTHPFEAKMLAIVFACRKFYQCIYSRNVVVETDHKPLQAPKYQTTFTGSAEVAENIKICAALFARQ